MTEFNVQLKVCSACREDMNVHTHHCRPSAFVYAAASHSSNVTLHAENACLDTAANNATDS